MTGSNRLRDSALEQSLALHGPKGLWSLWLAIPLDVGGLYLAAAWFHLVPTEWAAAAWDRDALFAGAVASFLLARAIALLAVGRVLHWRAASERWSRIAARDPRGS
jgi:hypothetical protein